jgi:hypothetical protein
MRRENHHQSLGHGDLTWRYDIAGENSELNVKYLEVSYDGLLSRHNGRNNPVWNFIILLQMVTSR